MLDAPALADGVLIVVKKSVPDGVTTLVSVRVAEVEARLVALCEALLECEFEEVALGETVARVHAEAPGALM